MIAFLILIGVAFATLAVTAARHGTDYRLFFGLWRTREPAAAAFFLALSIAAGWAYISRLALLR